MHRRALYLLLASIVLVLTLALVVIQGDGWRLLSIWWVLLIMVAAEPDNAVFLLGLAGLATSIGLTVYAFKQK